MHESSRDAGPRLLVFADASSIHTEQWLQGLAVAGHSTIELVTMNPAGIREGIRAIPCITKVHELRAASVKPGGGNWRYLFNLRAARRIAREVRADAIIALYLSSYGLVAAAMKGSAILAQVVLGSDVMTTPDRSAAYRVMARWALRRSDLVVSPSRSATERVAALSDIARDTILTLQYGLEDWVLESPPLPKEFDVVSNRAWVANSQIPLVLEIVARAQRPASVALIGDGPTLGDRIRVLAARDPRVRILGTLPHRENIEVLAKSAFYLSMTASDGASVSLLEAMAVGAIPLVSDIEPNREWIEDAVNGALLPLHDPAAAARRVDAFLALPDSALEEMRRRNREIVRERGSRTRNLGIVRLRLDELMRIGGADAR